MSRSLVGASVLVLAACGFHLRSWDLAAAFDTARVESDPSVSFVRDLERALESAGVSVVEEGAAVVVNLGREVETRRSVSVTGQARAAEYEIEIRVVFSVADASGVELVAPRTLSTERVFQLDRDNIVGSSDEQTLLVREMRADFVQRIMQTLGTLTRIEETTDAA